MMKYHELIEKDDRKREFKKLRDESIKRFPKILKFLSASPLVPEGGRE